MITEKEMTGAALREARTNAGMSQVGAAECLGVSQTLLSLMEKGERSVTPAVAQKVVAQFDASPVELPVSAHDHQLAEDLGALGYPGYRYLQSTPRNPAEVLLDALDRPNLDARLVEALPWLPLQYPEMNWEWLTAQVKLRNRQNRLGFVVALARKAAMRQAKHETVKQLAEPLNSLEEARLAKADTLCQDSWPPSQRQFAHKFRSRLAAHWNLDTRLTEDHFVEPAA
jgi:transcriptional regulator with XRE-family HTH domain